MASVSNIRELLNEFVDVRVCVFFSGWVDGWWEWRLYVEKSSANGTHGRKASSDAININLVKLELPVYATLTSKMLVLNIASVVKGYKVDEGVNNHLSLSSLLRVCIYFSFTKQREESYCKLFD